MLDGLLRGSRKASRAFAPCALVVVAASPIASLPTSSSAGVLAISLSRDSLLEPRTLPVAHTAADPAPASRVGRSCRRASTAPHVAGSDTCVHTVVVQRQNTDGSCGSFRETKRSGFGGRDVRFVPAVPSRVNDPGRKKCLPGTRDQFNRRISASRCERISSFACCERRGRAHSGQEASRARMDAALTAHTQANARTEAAGIAVRVMCARCRKRLHECVCEWP